MAAVNLTVEQLVGAFNQLRPEELKQVSKELRQRLANESEAETQHTLTAAAIEAADWWDVDGDKEWDQWQP